MTNETKPLLLADSDEQTLVALAHLSMIAQAANGEYRPRSGEIEQRQAWLTSFIRTGQGIVSEADRQLARRINDLLSTQSGILSTQPNAA
jgi:hypothetical protein